MGGGGLREMGSGSENQVSLGKPCVKAPVPSGSKNMFQGGNEREMHIMRKAQNSGAQITTKPGGPGRATPGGTGLGRVWLPLVPGVYQPGQGLGGQRFWLSRSCK